MSETPFVLVGLGNPGGKYHMTRHNAGFMVLDALAEGVGAELGSEKWSALWASCRMGGRKVHLLKPCTYMNLSGRAVARFVGYYQCPLDNLLVIHDDLDMSPGRLKLVRGGGSGGHNGIKSIVDALGGNDFFRLKIGIGRPGRGGVHPDFPVDKFVLAPFSEQELLLFEQRLPIIRDGISLLIGGKLSKAVNLINSVKGTSG